jgi:uncharacterized protein YndB with AHSA1/START domain
MSKKVERTITIAAKPERVWQAWVEEMNEWWTKPYYNDHGRVTGLSMEPWLGGRYIEKWDENGAGFLIGIIVEWLPPVRLAYTWSERGWGGVQTLVRIEFEPEEQGGTRLTYVQEGFDRLADSDRQRDGYGHGCDELLSRLQAHIGKSSAK